MANRREFISKLIGKMNTARGLREVSADVTPKATETLRALCTAEKGVGLSSMPLHHYGSSFKRVVPGLKSHRVVPGFMSQGEIFTRGYASGGVQQVKDESLRHSGFGTRSIANAKRSSLATEFEEIMADYVHHEITRTWILVLMRLFVIIAMKDIIVHLFFAEPEDHED